MKLKKVHLSNYRNFKDYQIEFGAKTTISSVRMVWVKLTLYQH